MKKNLFMVAAVALMALVSCNKEEINNNVVEQPQEEPTVIVEFEAGFDVETKTALDADGKKTVWKSDDRISINGQEFKISEIKENGKAIFVNVNDLPKDFAAPFTAIYPYGSDGSVPAEQDAVAGNFDPKAVIEKATSDNYSLSFKNETSLLKFQVEAACDAVTLSSDDDLATGSKTVTIKGDFKTGETYYVAVLPGEKANFVVRLDGYFSKEASSVNIANSSIVNMKNLPAPVKGSWGIVGSWTNWGNDIPMYKEGKYEVARGVELKSTYEFKLRKDAKWDAQIAGGIVAPNTERKAGWVNMTISEEGVYDIYVDASTTTYKYYIMTPGKTPAEASQPGPITITVIFDGDTNRNYLHMWSDGGEIANNKSCTSTNPFKWTVTVPAGDQQNRDYQVILKKGSGWNSYKTADSDKMCLRNPMPLKIVSNKAVHK